MCACRAATGIYPFYMLTSGRSITTLVALTVVAVLFRGNKHSFVALCVVFLFLALLHCNVMRLWFKRVTDVWPAMTPHAGLG